MKQNKQIIDHYLESWKECVRRMPPIILRQAQGPHGKISTGRYLAIAIQAGLGHWWPGIIVCHEWLYAAKQETFRKTRPFKIKRVSWNLSIPIINPLPSTY